MSAIARWKAALVSRGRATAGWLDERLGVGAALGEALRHPVPLNSASWWYVFGSATLTSFLVLVATGLCLALVYVPSAAQAWHSLDYLTYEHPLGWYVRGLHYWASNVMLAMLLVHLLQVFLFGAYKYPRELTWVVGVFLLLCVLANSFTGQVLRFDQDAYWGLGIGVAVTGRAPGLGPFLVDTLLGGPIVGGRTLSRFYLLHVMVVPGLIAALVAVHLRLVLRLGVNEPPEAGRPVDRATYRARYREGLEREGVPFFPNAAWRDAVFAALVVLAILALAALFGPKGPGGAPDPTQIRTTPRPDFPFLWLFAVLALLPPYLETPLLLTMPLVIIAFLVAIPFLFGTGEKSPRRRPVAVVSLVLLLTSLGVLTRYGETAPWSPRMHAWSGDAVPERYVRGRSPLELAGSLVLQEKQCRNCHALGGVGGRRGPALDDVATRLGHDALVRQVLQGGGNMPAYGRRLEPAEVAALVAFLETLRPGNERAVGSVEGSLRGAPAR